MSTVELAYRADSIKRGEKEKKKKLKKENTEALRDSITCVCVCERECESAQQCAPKQNVLSGEGARTRWSEQFVRGDDLLFENSRLWKLSWLALLAGLPFFHRHISSGDRLVHSCRAHLCSLLSALCSCAALT